MPLLPEVQLAFNTRHMYYADLSPAMLLLGYQPRFPVQNLIQPPVVPTPDLDVNQLRTVRLARLDAWRMEAVDRQITRWNSRFDNLEKGVRQKHEPYRVGDLVLFQNYPLVGKSGNPWDQRWRGPVRISRISRKGKLDLHHPSGNFVLKGWHTDRVRPYHLLDENRFTARG